MQIVLRSEAMLSHNLSSSGSGLISPTGVTLSLPDNNPTGTNQCISFVFVVLSLMIACYRLQASQSS